MNSYLAILIAGLIPMVLGFIWYHPKVFGNAWMRSLGFTEESMKEGNMAMTMGLATLCALFLAWRINEWSSHTEPGMSQFVHGFFHGAWGVGIPAAVVLVSNSLFQRNTASNMLINALYWVVATGLMGAFLYSVAAPEAAQVG